MKNKMLPEGKLVILIVIIAIASVISIWRYYTDRNKKIEAEILQINKNI